LKHILQTTLLAILASSLAMADLTYNVTLNTTPLNTTQGYLAFDFLQGSPVENNTATISSFTSDATLGTLTLSGDATGTISPGPGTLDDINNFFNEFLQQVTFGTTISFNLSLTTNGAPTPDNFAFYLLDSSQFPIVTSDPTGADSLFSIDITGPGLTPNVYTSADATATVTPAGTAAPEPSTFWLVGISLAGLLPLLKRRKKLAAWGV
jgi:hypothetical protein